MSLFNHNKIVDPNNELLALKEVNESLKAEIDDFRKTVAGFVDIKASYEQHEQEYKKKVDLDMLNMKRKYQMALDVLNNRYESEKKSVNRKVNIALSNIGVKKFAPEEVMETNQSPEQIQQMFFTMPEGPEKATFFKAHEKTITQFTKGMDFLKK